MARGHQHRKLRHKKQIKRARGSGTHLDVHEPLQRVLALRVGRGEPRAVKFYKILCRHAGALK